MGKDQAGVTLRHGSGQGGDLYQVAETSGETWKVWPYGMSYGQAERAARAFERLWPDTPFIVVQPGFARRLYVEITMHPEITIVKDEADAD